MTSPVCSQLRHVRDARMTTGGVWGGMLVAKQINASERAKNYSGAAIYCAQAEEPSPKYHYRLLIPQGEPGRRALWIMWEYNPHDL